MQVTDQTYKAIDNRLSSMRRLSYDPQVDAAYIRLEEGAFQVTTHQLNEDVAINYAPDGRIVGIEILSASNFSLQRRTH